MKLLHNLKERRGYSHLKEEALDCTIWRARFGRGFGPVVRQNTKWMNELMTEWINEHIYIYRIHGQALQWPVHFDGCLSCLKICIVYRFFFSYFWTVHCNKNQQNCTLVTLMFQFTNSVFDMFRTSKCSSSLSLSSTSLPSTRLLIWMHERNTIKLQVQVFLRMNNWMFETCRRHYSYI